MSSLAKSSIARSTFSSVNISEEDRNAAEKERKRVHEAMLAAQEKGRKSMGVRGRRSGQEMMGSASDVSFKTDELSASDDGEPN